MIHETKTLGNASIKMMRLHMARSVPVSFESGSFSISIVYDIFFRVNESILASIIRQYYVTTFMNCLKTGILIAFNCLKKNMILWMKNGKCEIDDKKD